MGAGALTFILTGAALLAPIHAVMFGSAHAAQPVPWQLDLQPAATPLMEQTASLHAFLLYLAFAISFFVLLLLAYVMIKFNAKANPVPSKTSHNTPLEIIWTLIPVLILIVVSVPSFSLLYAQKTLPPIDMTIKATGYQWYWGYEYPDHDNIAFDALMLFDDELAEGQPRLLATDNAVVVPVN
ncbi:MAG: cytochrome c oxidase subunit II, partial [Alphaproteobacteria bacterium]|nr:cytochrome c oxidase subunit II [Alphaproteobacteria bacterium]